MKKTLAMLLSVMLLLCALPALAEGSGMDFTKCNLTLNATANTFAYKADGEKRYQVMDADGSFLTDVEAGYTSMYVQSATGYYKVQVNAEDGVHREGLLDGRGNLIVPPVYADIKVISDRWQAGVKLVPCAADDKDYSYSVWGSDEKLFFRVDTVDNYFDGQLIGSLPRTDFSDATARGAYLAVRNQARETTFYNSKMEASSYKANGNREYDSVYADRTYTYYHQGSGQKAFVPECTLTADEVENPFMYDQKTRTMYDLQGNALFTMEKDYTTVHSFKNGYAKVYYNSRYGVIDLQGKEVIPPIYEELNDYSDRVFAFGYVIAKKDGKLGFINEQGRETTPFTYVESTARERGNFLEISDPSGAVVMVSGAVGQLKDQYQRVDYPSYQGCFAFVAKDAEGNMGVVDMFGRVQVPFDAYKSINLSNDGSLALIQVEYGAYSVAHLDTSVPDDAILSQAQAAAADNGEWTCSNGHGGNTRNFCPECGEPRPQK